MSTFFEISGLERIEQKSLVAVFDVTLAGVAIRKCRYYFTRRRGAFITGPTSRAGWLPGGWEVFAEFDEDLAREIQAAVEARLDADAQEIE